ncbi:MAG: NUDIX hydrolase [Rhabdochlamydiaceae bacterium]|jgi:8-oxo-dGTP diphosphatase
MDHKEDSFHLGVKALIHNNAGKLLLLQLNTKEPKSTKGTWDIPGGRVQKNESLEAALRREVYEETGLHVVHMTPFVMALSNIRIPVQSGDVGLIFAIYLCDIIGDSPITLGSEHTHFDWFEPSRAVELLTANYPLELTEKLARWRLNG